MRLKLLFFPIMLVLSMAVVVIYILPEVGKIKVVNETWIAKSNELQLILDKKKAIELVGEKISSDVEGESLIVGYVPKNKTEERIISGISYLASDANVSIIEMSLSSVPAKKVVESAVVAMPDPIGDPLLMPASQSQPVLSSVSIADTTAAKISLVGDYAKIRVFLDNLQRMPILNTIKSINILKPEEKTGEDAVADAAPSDSLKVEVVVDFGYLGFTEVKNTQFENFDTALDTPTMDTLKTYISQKSQLNLDEGAKGKSNPFLAN